LTFTSNKEIMEWAGVGGRSEVYVDFDWTRKEP